MIISHFKFKKNQQNRFFFIKLNVKYKTCSPFYYNSIESLVSFYLCTSVMVVALKGLNCQKETGLMTQHNPLFWSAGE